MDDPAEQNREVAKARHPLSLRKKIAFSALTAALFFCAIEAILFACGVRTGHHRDPLAGFSSHYPLFVPKDEQGDNPVLHTAQSKYGAFNYQTFRKHKEPGAFRIFCVGGSTTFGRPFDDRTAFSGWLRVLLPIVDSRRKWEVINAGGISYASYRVAKLMEELVQYEPDLFVIYSGHNEFLEKRTYQSALEMSDSWVGRLLGVLSRTRTGGLVAGAVRSAPRSEGDAHPDSRGVPPDDASVILDETVGPSDYHRDDAQRRRVVREYGSAIERMVRLARNRGAKVLLVVPASNLKDCEPFKGEHEEALTHERRVEWNALYKKAIGEGGQRGLEYLRKAEAVDGRLADLHYRKGHLLYDLGEYAESLAAFQRARDEDVCPLRGIGPIVASLRAVASRLAAPIVDFEQILSESSEHGVPGRQFFHDHVHPTISGHRLLAQSIVDAMGAQGWATPSVGWRDPRIEEAIEEVKKGIDVQDHARAIKNIAKVLGWAGKVREAYAASLRSIEMYAGDPEAHCLAGSGAADLGKEAEAVMHFRKALAVRPTYVPAQKSLAMLLSVEGDQRSALALLKSVVESRPNDGWAHEKLGVIYGRLGDLDRAVGHLRRSLEINGASAPVLYNMGLAFERMNDVESALACYRKASALKPEWRPPADRLAQLGGE